jgi:multiple sugar transport system substrate-binding protein
MKRLLSIFIVFLFTASLLAACGNSSSQTSTDSNSNSSNSSTSNSSNNSSSDSSDNSSKTIIKFACQADNTPATEKLIQAFNTSQDKYEVEWVEFTNDSAQMHDQLLTSLSSGSDEYDAISMDVVWAGEFGAAGYLKTIDTKMKEVGFKKSDFNSGSMASGNYKGKQYTLPFFPDLGLLYYRKDIVSEEDGKKLETGDYTYKDLAAMAEKYSAKEGTEAGFVYQSKQYEGLTCNVTEFTGSFSDIKNGLQTMKIFTDADWTPADILNYTEGETHNSFTEGKSVFSRNWPYQYGMIKSDDTPINVDQISVAPLPKGGTVGGWLLGINKKSSNIDGAWEFIKFAAGKDGQKIMSTIGGYLPGYNELLTDSDVLSTNPMLSYEGFSKALQTTISRPVSAEYSKTSDSIQHNVHAYLSGGQDLDTTTAEIEKILEK